MSLSTDLHAEFIPLSTHNWGQNGPYKLSNRLPFNPVVYCLVASFHAIAFWVCVELTIYLFFTFKRRGSMYFGTCFSRFTQRLTAYANWQADTPHNMGHRVDDDFR